MKKNPIGIFDSGVGGLTILEEITGQLPFENVIYLADSANCPYGTKSHTEIIELSIKNTEFLLSKNCKIIVVACNTATAAAVEALRSNFNIPIIGMEPAVKPAALNTNTGKIGILATKGTFNGKLFKETSKKYANNIDKIIQIGEGLVELVEENKYNSIEAKTLLNKYLTPMIDQQVDQIVLGCTHYPFFKPLIKELIPDHIEIIDSAPAIARRTRSVLIENKLENNNGQGNFDFYSTGNLNTIKTLAKELFQNKSTFKKITLYTN